MNNKNDNLDDLLASMAGDEEPNPTPQPDPTRVVETDASAPIVDRAESPVASDQDQSTPDPTRTRPDTPAVSRKDGSGNEAPNEKPHDQNSEAPSDADEDDDEIVAEIDAEIDEAPAAPADPTPTKKAARPSPAVPKPAPPKAAAPEQAATEPPAPSERRASSGRASSRRSSRSGRPEKKKGGIKHTATPVLFTLGILLLGPAIWASMILMEIEGTANADRDGVKSFAKLMLVCWPIGLILIITAGIFVTQILREKKAEKQAQAAEQNKQLTPSEKAVGDRETSSSKRRRGRR